VICVGVARDVSRHTQLSAHDVTKTVVLCVVEAGDGSTNTHLSADGVTKTCEVGGDDYQRHRWQCTTSLVSFMKLYLFL